jgi:hypothetical protein
LQDRQRHAAANAQTSTLSQGLTWALVNSMRQTVR